VTSYDWLFLTDIHDFKQVLVNIEKDLTGYEKLFGHLDNNKRCYLAPEKVYEAE
jgi:hypothetical protein